MQRSILPAAWQVPQEFRNRLGNQAGRQRAMMADKHLLLVLHRPPGPDEVGREGRFFWRQPDGMWSSSSHGAGIGSLAKHTDEYSDLIQKYDQSEEQAVSAPDYFRVINDLSPLLRAARHLHQVLQDGRKMCPEDRELINLRDAAYEIERNAELLYNDAKNSLEFLVARRTEEQAQTSHRMEMAAHRLNLLAAFFLPLATISSILEVGPDQMTKHLQNPVSLITLAAIGLAGGWLLTRVISQAAARKDDAKKN
jgi:hypothetical protein